jgi:prepilin-type processing-associated H-X9-DG protein
MELVVVIAIIAGIASVTVPAYKAIKQSAQKMIDVSHLKKIAAGWREFTIERKYRMDMKTVSPGGSFANLGDWFAFFWGGMEYSLNFNPSKCILNDSKVYISLGDKYASTIKGPVIIKATTNSYKNGWNAVNNSDLGFYSSKFFWSYCVIGNIPDYADLSTTPLAFTRGLKDDGTWDEKYGLYGSKGGYIVFCDGHVKWFDGDKPVKLLKWDKSGYTSDIRETVPNAASFGCGGACGTPNAPYNTLVIWGDGTGGD